MKNLCFVAILGLLLSCSGSGEKKSNLNTEPEQPKKETITEKKRIILFFGNSITAGYQLDMEEAFPAIIQSWIDSLEYNYQVVNAGLSGETSASGKNRIDWVLRTVPEIFVLELGGNDGLRGLPLEETIKNLQAIIDAVKEINPEVTVIIAGMEVPPNLGQDYTSEFRNMFPQLAQQNDAILIPFILDKVAGNPDLNLDDGIHPTPEGHLIVAQTVWKYLNPALEKRENL